MIYERLEPGNYYHIYNRGNNKENLFIEEKNYTYFLNLLSKHILPIAYLLSYCLLKNHFHLLVHTKNEVRSKQISQSFSNLFNAYAKAVNKSYNRTGSLFSNRFKRIKITDENYLRTLIIYINNNAVHHGFTQNIEDYNHSSYQSLLSDDPTFLKRAEVLDLFDSRTNFIRAVHQKQHSIDGITLE